MAVDAEIFPVGAVRRVIAWIAVFMVHRKKMPIFEIKLSAAFGADKAMNFQGLLPVSRSRDLALFQFPDHFSSALDVAGLARQRPSELNSLPASQTHLLMKVMYLL